MSTNHSTSRRAFLGACCAVAAAATLTGCQTQGGGSTKDGYAGMLNTTCPMMPNCGKPASATVAYKGGTVGFCCKGCVNEWNGLTEDQKAARLGPVARR